MNADETICDNTGAPRILLVEDEAIIALMIEDMLLDSGYAIAATVASVDDAIEAVTHLKLDGAILDINLNGYRIEPVAKALAAKQVPFIFSTGYGNAGIDPEFRDRPVLTKPFHFSALVEMLHAVFGPARPR